MKREVLFVAALAITGNAAAGWFDSATNLLDTASKATAVASDVMKSTGEQTETTAESADAGSLTDTAMALLPSLTQGLGVTETQAAGGMGSLLQLAQGTLGASDFAALGESIPGVDSLLAAAPTVAGEESKGMASGLMDMVGLPGEAISSAATVTAQFKELGLSPAMIPQYIQVANEFLQSNGGQQAVELFGQGVASLL